MTPNLQSRWKTVPDAALASREWDGELVVFNQVTGNTHLLDELPAEVLRLLMAERRGVTQDALVAAFTDAERGEVVDWTKAIDDVLSEFSRLGLAQSEQP